MGAEMALQLASESLGEREERDFQRRLENPPSPATERRLLLTAKRFHTVCLRYEKISLTALSTNAVEIGGRSRRRRPRIIDVMAPAVG